MDKALCVVSHEQPRPDGTWKKFEAGVIYPTDGMDEESIKTYFEHPTLAPPKRTMRRDTTSTDGQEHDQ